MSLTSFHRRRDMFRETLQFMTKHNQQNERKQERKLSWYLKCAEKKEKGNHSLGVCLSHHFLFQDNRSLAVSELTQGGSFRAAVPPNSPARPQGSPSPPSSSPPCLQAWAQSSGESALLPSEAQSAARREGLSGQHLRTITHAGQQPVVGTRPKGITKRGASFVKD